MWKVATRFKIVGIEVVGLGVYNLLVLLLQLREAPSQSIVQSFGWDYAIIGGVLIAVGLELLSLIKHLPTHDLEEPDRNTKWKHFHRSRRPGDRQRTRFGTPSMFKRENFYDVAKLGASGILTRRVIAFQEKPVDRPSD
jgi:hypothetical protein